VGAAVLVAGRSEAAQFICGSRRDVESKEMGSGGSMSRCVV